MTCRLRKRASLSGQLLSVGLLIGLAPWIALAPWGTSGQLVAQEKIAPSDYSPRLAEASDEGQRAIATFRVPEGLKVSLWAAEPLLANPVAFAFDDRGRCFVVETFRLHRGVTDIRSHMHWLNEDLASRTVEDRVAMYKRQLGDRFASYSEHSERIRRLVDTNGDGTADRATVFADGYRDPEVGLAAGVLPVGDAVYFTCIPNLYKLRDTQDDGHADEQTVLASGFGVHVGFIGHDLHGLRLGHDGRLYFSIGDRGLNVVNQEGQRLFYPDTGAVLRCELDGSGLEVFATGLRNPQELAFDKFGNLFTGDNDSDAGDRARWVHLVEGGDSGWRIGYQFIERPVARGPWNEEKMWHEPHAEQAAFLVPPVAVLGDGPSGLCYHPGTGLGGRWTNHFFLADFRGGPANSGIRSFAVEPRGASFRLINSDTWVWQVLATDVDFGPDGAVYLTDWVNGWGQTGKGRIYRIADPADAQDPVIAQVQRLLHEGLEGRPANELESLLGHPDQRIRLRAQLALADRPDEAVGVFRRVALNPEGEQLARLHAIWGLRVVARRTDRPELVDSLAELLADNDAEVRAQVVEALGEARREDQAAALAERLADDEPKVRLLAGIALGKVGGREQLAALIAMLEQANDQDAFLRHAGVMGLVGITQRLACRGCLDDAARHASAAVRRAVTVAYRRLNDEAVARMLDDEDPAIVLEAARAINDAAITTAFEPLGKLIDRDNLSLPLALRVLNARFRQGRPADAEALAKFATREDQPARTRVEALKMLAEWAEPSGRDRLVGLWRPLEPRDPEVAAGAVAQHMAKLLADRDDGVALAAAETAGGLRVAQAAEPLFAVVGGSRASRVRAAAVRALADLADAQRVNLAEALHAVRPALAADEDDTVRAEATRMLSRINPAAAVEALVAELDAGQSIAARQAALATLAEMQRDEADQVLVRWLDRLSQGQAPSELALDIVEAARRREVEAVKTALVRYEQSLAEDDPHAQWRLALHGGDAQRGRDLFFNRTEFSCLRCHKIGSEGSEVGPELTQIAKTRDRVYLWESIVDPNKDIAEGFSTVVLELDDGRVVTGVLRGETDQALTLVDNEGKRSEIPKASVEFRASGLSAMPADLVEKMTARELRDLVAYLVSLKPDDQPQADDDRAE